MKFTDKSLRRPQYEGGHDYQCGRRSILVDATNKWILHVEGSKKGKDGDPDHKYRQTCIVAFPDEGEDDRQRILARGRLDRQCWEDIAGEIFDFLGCEPFDVSLISKRRTLMLDVPGQITDRPGKGPSAAAKRLLEEGTISASLNASGRLVVPSDVFPKSKPEPVSPVASKPVVTTLAEQLAEAEQQLRAAAQKYTMLLLLWQQETGQRA